MLGRVLVVSTLLISIFSLTFVSCRTNRPSHCDIPAALLKARTLKEVPSYLVEFKLNRSLSGINEFTPNVTSLYEANELIVPTSDGTTGAKVQVLDKNGKKLFENDIDNPFAIRQKIGGEILQSGNKQVVKALDQFIEQQTFVYQIPRLEDGAKVKFLFRDPKAEIKAANLGTSVAPRSYEFDLAKIPRKKFAEDTGFKDAKVTPLHFTSNSSNRLNIVVLSDGYQSHEMEKFREDLKRVFDKFITNEPFQSRKMFFNVWQVEMPSVESGASCDDKTNHIRHNRFGSVFPIACFNATFGTNFNDRFIMQTHIFKVLNSVKVIRKHGAKGAIIPYVLTNSEKDGATAILWASQSRPNSGNVMAHELGHSFGRLADEYTVKGDPCNIFMYFSPNISTKKSHRMDVKWREWIDHDTPIPTKDEEKYAEHVGLFKRAANCSFYYRPQKICKMKSSKRRFCKVCYEEMLLRMYDFVRPIEGEIRFERLANGKTRFSVDTPYRGVKTVWLVNGQTKDVRDQYFDFETKLSSGEDHKVTVAVIDDTDDVRNTRCHLFEARSVKIPAAVQK